jgi:hydrogenase-1 operon protein HyaF
MTDFTYLPDEGLVDALIMEIADLLRRLIEHGEAGSTDPLRLPLSPSRLLDAAGRSTIRETSFPGVWWTTHADDTGRVIAMLIEVAFVPHIVRADIDDVARGCQRLPGATNAARRARRTVA